MEWYKYKPSKAEEKTWSTLTRDMMSSARHMYSAVADSDTTISFHSFLRSFCARRLPVSLGRPNSNSLYLCLRQEKRSMSKKRRGERSDLRSVRL